MVDSFFDIKVDLIRVKEKRKDWSHLVASWVELGDQCHLSGGLAIKDLP